MTIVIDKVVLDLTSLFLASAGIFSVLTKFYVPQLNLMYMGHNPHGIKRDAIDSISTWIFLLLGLVGILLQGYSIIDDHSLKRLHTRNWYLVAFVLGMVGTIFLTYVLGKVGKFFAKKKWGPELGRRYAKNLEYLHFMVGHESEWSQKYKDRKRIKDIKAEESFRSANVESAQEMIADLERIFEIDVKDTVWVDRLLKVHKFILPYYVVEESE